MYQRFNSMTKTFLITVDVLLTNSTFVPRFFLSRDISESLGNTQNRYLQFRFKQLKSAIVSSKVDLLEKHNLGYNDIIHLEHFLKHRIHPCRNP